MATTVHLPPELLQSVDRRAGELGVSRNRYIIRALETAIAQECSWSPGFLEALEGASNDREGQRTVDELSRSIAKGRTRKAAPEL